VSVLRLTFRFFIIAVIVFSLICPARIHASAMRDVPPELKRLDGIYFNQYISNFIISQQDAIKKAGQTANNDRFSIRDLVIQSVGFNINTGTIDMRVKVWYKYRWAVILGLPQYLTTDTTMTLNAELRASQDSTGIGIYIADVNDINTTGDIFGWFNGSVRSCLQYKEFWSDQINQEHPDFYVLNNDSFIQFVNQRINGIDLHFDTDLPGGTVEEVLKKPTCQLFNINEGSFGITSDFDVNVALYTGSTFNFDNAGSMKLAFDLYYHTADQSWWANIHDFQLTVFNWSDTYNQMLTEAIQAELDRNTIFIPLGKPFEKFTTPTPISETIPIAPQPLPVPSPLPTKRVISTMSREIDPVVITGDRVPSLLGNLPANLVAFHYQNGIWRQIPVQVDERAVIDILKPYHVNEYLMALYDLIGMRHANVLCYTDPQTFTGPDPDSTFDADDEIAFMAKDAGDSAPAHFNAPKGTIANTGVKVTMTDPLNGQNIGYVYLFKQDGSLSPAAGEKYVTYQFSFADNYMAAYHTGGGPNPEDTYIVTPYYAHHFSDRWIDDGLYLSKSNFSINLLDRHKNLFGPGNGTRSEDTFCRGKNGFPGEGCFGANINGPVRAIRSYMGANSGYLTQREHIFYEKRQDITSYVRVHSIGGLMDFFDYSPSAASMYYANNLNLNPVVIDGISDYVLSGPIQWEMVTGEQGSLAFAHTLTTDIPDLKYTSYYLDDASANVIHQPTGDAFAYGSSGIWISPETDEDIPNTDPSLPGENKLEIKRSIYYGDDMLSTQDARNFYNQVNNPLTITVESL
jgi:hypothetical protein